MFCRSTCLFDCCNELFISGGCSGFSCSDFFMWLFNYAFPFIPLILFFFFSEFDKLRLLTLCFFLKIKLINTNHTMFSLCCSLLFGSEYSKSKLRFDNYKIKLVFLDFGCKFKCVVKTSILFKNQIVVEQVSVLAIDGLCGQPGSLAKLLTAVEFVYAREKQILLKCLFV